MDDDSLEFLAQMGQTPEPEEDAEDRCYRCGRPSANFNFTVDGKKLLICRACYNLFSELLGQGDWQLVFRWFDRFGKRVKQ